MKENPVIDPVAPTWYEPMISLMNSQTRDWQALRSNPADTVRLDLPPSVAIENSTSAENRPGTDHTAWTPADLGVSASSVHRLYMAVHSQCTVSALSVHGQAWSVHDSARSVHAHRRVSAWSVLLHCTVIVWSLHGHCMVCAWLHTVIARSARGHYMVSTRSTQSMNDE